MSVTLLIMYEFDIGKRGKRSVTFFFFFFNSHLLEKKIEAEKLITM